MDVEPLLVQLCGKGTTARDRVQASAAAAGARPVVAGHLGVADLAQQATRTAHHMTVDDQSTRDHCPDLQAQEHARIRIGRPMLADGEEVHVTVDEHRTLEARLQPLGQRERPPRHRPGPASGNLEVGGQADADAVQPPRVGAHLREPVAEVLVQHRQQRIGALADVEIDLAVPEHVRRQVRDGHQHAAHPDLRSQRHARGRVERHAVRGAATGAAGLPQGDDQAVLEQHLEALGDRGASHAHRRCQVGRRLGGPAPEQVQDLPGARQPQRRRRRLGHRFRGHSLARSHGTHYTSATRLCMRVGVDCVGALCRPPTKSVADLLVD